MDLQTARNQVPGNKAYQGLKMLPADLYSFVLGILSCHVYLSIIAESDGCQISGIAELGISSLKNAL
ncbi:hypothetical protein O988_02760 [Pseudogymnoascus sp. VKM F-3808]|nr:hypothetical protein O988_02760 [Pseudogymnoascus sp. VKM F-3808]